MFCGRITYIVSNTEVYDSVMADVMKKIATQERQNIKKNTQHSAVHIYKHINQIQQLLRNVKCLRLPLVIFIWLFSLHTF